MTIEHVAHPRNFRIDRLQLGPAVELTIAAGLVAVTHTHHTIDTEADAAGDELDTISGGTAGDRLLLFAEASGRVVTLKHGAGNIRTPDGADRTLEVDGGLGLTFDGANWRVDQ